MLKDYWHKFAFFSPKLSKSNTLNCWKLSTNITLKSFGVTGSVNGQFGCSVNLLYFPVLIHRTGKCRTPIGVPVTFWHGFTMKGPFLYWLNLIFLIYNLGFREEEAKTNFT
jgi:hypothetical protein